MADSLDEKHIETGTNLAAVPAAQDAADPAANRAAEERRARIKKMRGWLSPRDTVADDFGPEDAALYYGEGHSGWNR
jgi:hypothetical protein